MDVLQTMEIHVGIFKCKQKTEGTKETEVSEIESEIARHHMLPTLN